MATTTPAQREALARLITDLEEAFAMIDGRFWAVRSQREAFETVLEHLRLWLDWESAD